MRAKQWPHGRGALARLRRRASDQDGLSIVELVIAISVLTITLSGVASGLTSALGLTRQNRSRTVAANLAAEDMEKVRAAAVTAAGFSSLQPPAFTETAVTEATVTVGSLPYTVRRETEWVSQSSTAGLCDGPNGTATPTFLRITVDVSWLNMMGVTPARSQTVIIPPGDLYDVNDGHIIVRVRDRAGLPIATTPVRVTDNSTGLSRTASTNAEGCVFFGFLEARAHTVVIDRSGYVDWSGSQSASQAVMVSAGATNGIAFDYDRAAQLNITFSALAGHTVPASLPVTLFSENLQPSSQQVRTGTGSPRTFSIFPFPSGYQTWAGSCSDSDPGASYRSARMTAEPGDQASGTVATAAVALTVRGYNNAPSANRPLIARNACGEDVSLGLTNASGQILTALPFGSWTFQVADRRVYSGSWPTVTLVVPGTPAVSLDLRHWWY